MIESCFIILGVLFITIGAIGVLNMPDTLCRSHALSKAMTFGISLMLIGNWLWLYPEISFIKIFLAILFQITTIPLSAHLIANYYWQESLNP